MSPRTSYCRRTPFACILLLLIVLRPETNADQLQAASSSAPTGPPQVSPDESVLSEYNPEAPPNPNPPPYTLLRFNEDYTYLADPLNRTDPFDPVKYIRSEEHTSELQSLAYLVCRLLLEKKKNN